MMRPFLISSGIVRSCCRARGLSAGERVKSAGGHVAPANRAQYCQGNRVAVLPRPRVAPRPPALSALSALPRPARARPASRQLLAHRAIRVRPPIPEELPRPANLFDHVEVHLGD